MKLLVSEHIIRNICFHIAWCNYQFFSCYFLPLNETSPQVTHWTHQSSILLIDILHQLSRLHQNKFVGNNTPLQQLLWYFEGCWTVHIIVNNEYRLICPHYSDTQPVQYALARNSQHLGFQKVCIQDAQTLYMSLYIQHKYDLTYIWIRLGHLSLCWHSYRATRHNNNCTLSVSIPMTNAYVTISTNSVNHSAQIDSHLQYNNEWMYNL